MPDGPQSVPDAAQAQGQALRGSSVGDDRPRDAHRLHHFGGQRHQSGHHRLQAQGPDAREIHAHRHDALPLGGRRAALLRSTRLGPAQGHRPQHPAADHRLLQVRLLQPRQLGHRGGHDQILRGRQQAPRPDREFERHGEHHRQVQERRFGHRPDQGLRGQRLGQVLPLLLRLGRPAGTHPAQEGRADDHEGDAHDPAAAREAGAAPRGGFAHRHLPHRHVPVQRPEGSDRGFLGHQPLERAALRHGGMEARRARRTGQADRLLPRRRLPRSRSAAACSAGTRPSRSSDSRTSCASRTSRRTTPSSIPTT